MSWKAIFWFLPRLLTTSLGLLCAGFAFTFAFAAVILQGLTAAIKIRC